MINNQNLDQNAQNTSMVLSALRTWDQREINSNISAEANDWTRGNGRIIYSLLEWRSALLFVRLAFHFTILGLKSGTALARSQSMASTAPPPSGLPPIPPNIGSM
jgi:hypothetical protein